MGESKTASVLSKERKCLHIIGWDMNKAYLFYKKNKYIFHLTHALPEIVFL